MTASLFDACFLSHLKLHPFCNYCTTLVTDMEAIHLSSDYRTDKLAMSKQRDDSSSTTPTSAIDDSSTSISSSRTPLPTTTRSLPNQLESALSNKTIRKRSVSPLPPRSPPRIATTATREQIPVQDPLEISTVEELSNVLTRYHRKFGKHSVQVAHVHNLIGNAYFRQGQYEAALDAYKRAVQCTPGEPLGDSYANIGTVYWTIGQVDNAIDFLKRAHDVHEFTAVANSQNPKESLLIATVAYQLGIAYTLKTNYRKALKHFAVCQDIRERVLPANHIDIARVMDATGKVYGLRKRPGDLETALKYHEEAFHVKHSLPKRKRDAAMLVTTLQSIAALHLQLADWESATYSHQLLLKMQKKLLQSNKRRSNNHDDSLRSDIRSDIRDTYITLWRLYQTIQDFEQAKCIRREACLYFKDDFKCDSWSDNE
ncbi:hypothetical protein MPSEU_000315900 [Mayamaea pseudoterrestris]|nr:hypothetical protein MPSEU_000315900 [Mayamaea pseudoterrestris]